MTSRDAAKFLGIGVTTLLRMEGVAYPVAPRAGKRQMRGFPVAIVEQVRKYLEIAQASRVRRLRVAL